MEGKAMETKALRDFATEQGITLRALQKHVKKHENELDGHIIRYGPPKGTYLDEYAQEYLSGLLVGHPLAVLDDNLSQELERVRIELEAAQKRIIELQDEKADLLERAIKAEATKALAETTTRDQAARIDDLESQLNRLKNRSLWQRVTRWGE